MWRLDVSSDWSGSPHRPLCLRDCCPFQICLQSQLWRVPVGNAGYLSASTEVSCQVCSLQFGSWINSQYGVEYRLPRNSTVGLTDFQPTVGWQVPSSKKSQNIVHTFPSSQVVNTKSRLVSGLARNPLVILTIFLFFNIFCIPLSSIRFLSFYLIAANRCCSASLQLKGIGACLRYQSQPISSLTTLVSSARPTLTAHLGSSERLKI